MMIFRNTVPQLLCYPTQIWNEGTGVYRLGASAAWEVSCRMRFSGNAELTELPKFSFLGTRKGWMNQLKASCQLIADDFAERKGILCYLFSFPQEIV